MNIEEWATAYVLKYGAQQIMRSGHVEDEADFLQECAQDIGVSNSVCAIVDELRRRGIPVKEDKDSWGEFTGMGSR